MRPSAVMTSTRRHTSDGRDGGPGVYEARPQRRVSGNSPPPKGRARYAAKSMLVRLRAWLDRWGAILPLLVAEFIVWLGFGGLLPILPIYFAEQGVDLGTLGLVIAAWPA